MKSFMEIGPHVFEKSGRQTDRRGSFLYKEMFKYKTNSLTVINSPPALIRLLVASFHHDISIISWLGILDRNDVIDWETLVIIIITSRRCHVAAYQLQQLVLC